MPFNNKQKTCLQHLIFVWKTAILIIYIEQMGYKWLSTTYFEMINE